MADGHVSTGSAQFVPLRVHILLTSFFAVTLLNQVILKNFSDDLVVLESISPAVLGASHFHVAVNMHRHIGFFVHVHRRKCFLLLFQFNCGFSVGKYSLNMW